MRKLLFFLLFAVPVAAQVSNPSIVPVAAPPTSCPVIPAFIYQAGSTLYISGPGNTCVALTTGSSIFTPGGDLGGTATSQTVLGLMHVTNAAIPAAITATPSVTVAAGGFVGSADTGSPGFTFGTNQITTPSGVNLTVNGTVNATGYSVGGTSFTGAWSQTTPTPTATTGTITTASSIVRVNVIGKTAFVSLSVAITTAGTGSGALRVALPFTSSSSLPSYTSLSCFSYSSTLLYLGEIGSNSSTVLIYQNNGTSPIVNGLGMVCSGVVETQ